MPSVIKRDIQLDVSIERGANNATVITGFRRVGKTYILYKTIKELLKTHSREEVIYINFEDERIIDPSSGLLTDLIPEIRAVYGRKPKYLFLDELQVVPNWSKWVRRILDTEPIRMFITGSSSKMGSTFIPTELRGRVWEVKINPLNFKEFLRFKGESINFEKLPFVKDEEGRFRYLFDEYLVFGGLPAVVLAAPEKKQELLQSYFQTVVYKDIAEKHKVSNNKALKTLLKLLLNSSYITVSKLHNSLQSMGISVGKSTVDNYISYIKESYLMDELYIFNPSVKNQLQYPRKVYFVDTGFTTALSTKFSRNIGRLFENVVFYKLAKEGEIIYYYKDRQGKEVDFAVLSEGKTTSLYQVCFDLTDEATRKREIKALLNAGLTLKCRDLNLITSEKPDGLKIPREIKVIPAAEFVWEK